MDIRSKPDFDITNILDCLQDDGEPEAIEVAPGCIEFPKDDAEREAMSKKPDPNVYPKSTLSGEVMSSKDDPESVGKHIEFNVPGLKCAPWRPGRACLAITRVVQRRQFESEWEVI